MTSSLRSSLLNAALFTAVIHAPALQAATLYWDANGPVTGSGNLGGFWEASNWNASSDGTGSPTSFANGDSAIFSAGTDGTGAFTVNIGGTISTPLIRLEETGLVTLSGGGIDITGGTTFDTSVLGPVTGLSLTWNPVISGAGTFTLAAHGDTSPGGGSSNTIFTLSGENTFTGDVVITSGIVGYTSNFGNAANKIVLDGGGIVNNTTGTFARNIEAGSNGGILRNYGAATTTHTGVLSGSGAFIRTDGGNFIVTQPATHTGPWNIQRGTVTVGTGTQTADLLATSGTITLGESGGAGILRYHLDTDLAWTRAVTFGHAAGTLAWQGAQPARTLTVANATSFTDPTLGKLQVANGELKLASSADVRVNEIGLTNADPANARLAVESGASLTARYLNIGDGNATSGTINQAGGDVTVLSGAAGIRIGHWTNGTNPGSTYNLSGGTLDATDLVNNTGEARWVSIGWDGQATLNVGAAGILKAAGIRLDRNRAGSANHASTLNLHPGGLIEIGELGIEGQGTNDSVVLHGGTLKATANSTWGAHFEATPATNTIIDVDGYVPRIAGTVSGTGTLTLNDSSGNGVLEIDSGAGTRTWTAGIAGSTDIIKIGAGTLILDGSHTNTGTLLVTGGALNLTGGIAAPLLDIDDGATLAGEGSTSGDLALGYASGATLIFDPSTPGALTIGGAATITGDALLLPATPFSGTVTVLTAGSPIVLDGTLGLPGGTPNYRSASISTVGNTITATINNERLVWTGAGGGVWDLDTSASWTNSSASGDNFFFGDDVLFDDSAAEASTTVTIAGILQPGLITVDSSVNQYLWNGDASNHIAGNASLLKKGSSILTVNAPNTYTGGTVIREGAIDIQQAGALGSGSVILGDGQTGDAAVALYLKPVDNTAAARVNFGTQVIVSGHGSATLGSRLTTGGAADNHQFTNILLQGDVTFDSHAFDRTDYENISGAGNITVTGAARSIFPTTPAVWTGDLTVATTGPGGSLQIGVASTAGNRIPDTSNVTVHAGALLRLSTAGETIAGLHGAGTVNPNAPSGGTATLTVGFGDANGDFSGILENGPNTLTLTKTGAGTQILSGNNTYTGATTINGGTLQIGNGGASGSLAATATSIASGGTLAYNRSGALNHAGALNHGGTVANAGTLAVDGGVTLTLGAAGNFSGTIQVLDGTLVYGVTNPVNTQANAPAIHLHPGAVLTNLGTVTHCHVGPITLDNATWTTGAGTGSYNGENYQLNGDVTVTGSAPSLITREASRTDANSGISLAGVRTFHVADATGSPAADLIVSTELENGDGGNNSANGSLVKTGAGTLLLNNANTYTGGTTLNEGTLGGTGSIPGPLLTTAGSTLAPGASAGTFTVIGSADIGGSLAIELDGFQADFLAVSGTLDITGASLNVSILPGGVTLPAYIVASYGSLAGTFAATSGIPSGYTIDYAYDDGFSTNNIALVQTGEPSDPYAAWAAANGIPGQPAGSDFDFDGIPNGIEFVLGTHPNANSNADLPTASLSADGLYIDFVFRRSDASMTLPEAQRPHVEYGSDLAGWTKAVHDGINVIIPAAEDDFYGPGIDRVTVRLLRSGLTSSGKLFARLRADIP